VATSTWKNTAVPISLNSPSKTNYGIPLSGKISWYLKFLRLLTVEKSERPEKGKLLEWQ